MTYTIISRLSELKTMDLIFILFYFIFLLFSLIFYWRVEDKEDKVWHCHRLHDTVTEFTHSCDTREQYERFWKDDIITIYGMLVGLKANT